MSTVKAVHGEPPSSTGVHVISTKSLTKSGFQIVVGAASTAGTYAARIVASFEN